MMEVFNALLPIAGILGLGGAGTVACLVIAFLARRYAFYAVIAASCLAVATFMYGKGVRDDYELQLARTREAINVEYDKEDKARTEAEKYVDENPVQQGGTANDGHRRSSWLPTRRVHDDYDRDQHPAKPGATPRRSVSSVAGDHVLGPKGQFRDNQTGPGTQQNRPKP